MSRMELGEKLMTEVCEVLQAAIAGSDPEAVKVVKDLHAVIAGTSGSGPSVMIAMLFTTQLALVAEKQQKEIDSLKSRVSSLESRNYVADLPQP